MPRLHAVAVALTVLSLSGSAAAQPAEGAAAIDELVVELGVKGAQLAHGLQAGNCVAACEALASMQRAAERICELEPGPRCDAAKRNVEEARQRVSEACPECYEARREGNEAQANQPPPKKPDDDDGTRDSLEELEQEDRPVQLGGSAPASAPPEEDSRGGCAACAVGDEPDGGGSALGWLALGAAVAVLRRRRRD
ncbi:MAG: MYXO-CTERM sorting domain-containing protein [Polyangiaceae bacterium]